VSEENGVWTIKTSTVLRSMVLSFELEKEFDHTTPDGRVVTVLVSQEGNERFHSHASICFHMMKKSMDKNFQEYQLTNSAQFLTNTTQACLFYLT
jgi:hypothetical protein